MSRILLLCLGLLSPLATAQDDSFIFVKSGEWYGWLDSPGGPLPFGMEFQREGERQRAWLINGDEKAEIPNVRFEGDEIVFDFVHYNSMIRAKANPNGTSVEGEWKKVQGPDKWTVMPFHATFINELTSQWKPGKEGIDIRRSMITESIRIAGRWSVQFESSADPAVGIIHDRGLNEISGTFLTTTGDYRYLGGTYFNRTIRMSVFDGAHAFLFIADHLPDDTIDGHFWSRDTWNETWTAKRDPEAKLPDAFTQTAWNEDVDLADLKFKTIDGELVSPADERFAGTARIIEVFGTWCPNCNDATNYLVELHKQYGERGLSILALAFEMTGDPLKDAKQVHRYIDFHGIEYPVLIAGVSDKAEATKAFGVLDRVRSYPTFIFLDGDDHVKAIYTGFSGPATGAAYDKLREDFERIIEELLMRSETTP